MYRVKVAAYDFCRGHTSILLYRDAVAVAQMFAQCHSKSTHGIATSFSDGARRAAAKATIQRKIRARRSNLLQNRSINAAKDQQDGPERRLSNICKHHHDGCPETP